MHENPPPMSDLPEIDALLARVPEGTTPGPWRCEDDGRGPTNGSYAAEAGIGVWSQVLFDKALNDRDVEDPLDEAWVCGIWGALGDEDRANAALISLAPELVTALRALRAEVERHSATISDLTRERDAQREALADRATKFDVIGAYVETGGGQQLSHAKIYEWATAARKLAALSTTKGGADA